MEKDILMRDYNALHKLESKMEDFWNKFNAALDRVFNTNRSDPTMKADLAELKKLATDNALTDEQQGKAIIALTEKLADAPAPA